MGKAAVEPFEYDRVYGAFLGHGDRGGRQDGRKRSAERYLRASWRSK